MIVKNSIEYKYIFALISSTALTALLNFVVQVYMARYSSVDVFGQYSIYTTTILIMFNVINLGLGHYYIKEFSQNSGDDKIEINSFLILLSSMVFGFFIISLIFIYLFPGFDYYLIFLLGSGVVGYALHEIIQSYYVGIQNKNKLIVWQPLLQIFRCIVLFVLIFIFGKLDFKLLSIFSFSFSFLILLIIFLMRNKIFYLNRGDFSIVKIKKILKNSIWFGMVGFLYVLYSQFGIIYVGKKLSAELAGFFNIGYTFVLLSLIIPNTFYYRFLLPKLHGWILYDKIKLKKSYTVGALLAFVTGTVISLFLIITSNFIVKNFYGENYLDAVNVFKIIVVSIPFFYLSIHFGVYSYLGGAQKYKVAVLLIVTIFSLLINYVSIENYGINGAAASLIVITFFMAVLYWCLNYFFIFNKILRDVK